MSSDATSALNQTLASLLTRGTSLPSAREGVEPSRELVRGGLRAPALPSAVGYALSGDARTSQGAAPSARYVGPVTGGALYNPSTPTSHPQRNRLLQEERLFWGWEVGAEGTAGAFLSDEVTFDTGGVDVTALPAADYRLVFLHRSDAEPTPLGAWPILGTLGTEITLTIDGPDAPDPGLTYTWQLIKAAPAPLLPVPNAEGPGSEVLYLMRKPDEWPANIAPLGQPIVKDANFVSGALSVDPVTGRYLLAAAAPYAGAIGDFLAIKSSPKAIFRVSSVGSPGPNDVELEPMWDVIVNELASGSLTFNRLNSVGEVAAWGAAVKGGLGGVQTLFDFPELLDAVRVYPLIDPMDGPPALRPYGQELVLDPPPSTFRGQFNLGYRVTLFPATVLGAPDLTRPISDLTGIVINPTLPASEVQSVVVDYATGAVLLSHPIPESGGDLNPAGFVDGNGQRRLWAMFASYNRQAAPAAAAALVQPDAGVSGSSLSWTEAAPTSPNLADRGPHWVFRLPEVEQYHPAPQPATGAPAGPSFPAFVFTSGSGLGSLPTYPRLGSAWRSPNSGLTSAQGLLFGRLNSSDSPNQVVVLPAATASSYNRLAGVEPGYDTANQPWMALQDGWKQTTLDVSLSSPITLGLNDTLELVLNDLPLSVTLPPGILPPTALQIVGALDAAILAASAVYSLPQTDGVTFQTEVAGASNQLVLVRARDVLYWGAGSGHSNVAAPVNTRVVSLEFIQAFGSGAAGRSQWELRDLNLDGEAQASWTGRDVNLQGGPSLRGAGRVVESAYAPCVLEGCEVVAGAPGFVDVASGRVFADAGTSGDVEGREVVIDPVSLDFAGQGGNLYYVFYDRDLGEVRYQGLPLTDPTFRAGPPTGVPLARVLWDGLGFEYIVDARVFPSQRLQNGILTVGTGGMFSKLHSAMWWCIEHPETVREVHLVSDVVVDYAVREQVYIPEGVTIQGNGYRIQANNFGTAGSSLRAVFVLADPFSDQATRNIRISNLRIDVTGTGAQEVTLWSDGGTSPPAGVGPVLVEDVSVTHAGALTEFYAGLVINYLGDFTLRRVSMQAGARLSHWVQSLASGALTTPSGLSVTVEGGSVLGALPQLVTSSMFWTSADTAWIIRDWAGSAAASVNPFAFWYGSLSSVRSKLLAERVTAYVGVGTVLRVNQAAVSATRTVLRLTDCTFSTEDDGQDLFGGPLIRDIDLVLTRTQFSRAAPASSVAGAGFNWGTTAGSTPSSYVFRECDLQDLYWYGDPGFNSRVVFRDVNLQGITGLEVNSATGLGQSLSLEGVRLEDGYLLLNGWGMATLKECRFRLNTNLSAPMIRIADADVKMTGCQLVKTSTDAQAVVLFQNTDPISFQASDVTMIHGNGVAGSPYGFRADAATIGASTFSQLQFSNLAATYIGTANTTAQGALFFPDRFGLTNLNLHMVNYFLQGYDSSAPLHYGVFVGTLYRRVNVVGGIAVNRTAGAVTQFAVDGSVVDYFEGDSARFINP